MYRLIDSELLMNRLKKQIILTPTNLNQYYHSCKKLNSEMNGEKC